MSSLIVYRKINWKIENISRESLAKFSKNKSISRTINVNFPENKTQEWILEFCPNTDPCEFYLLKLLVDDENLFIKARLYVEKIDGSLKYINSDEGNVCDLDENEGFDFSNMFKPQDMLAENDFVKENSLTFVIELELQKLEAPKKVNPLNGGLLSVSEYERVMRHKNLIDFKLICSDQGEIGVHKFVIAIKCPILMDMIDIEFPDHKLDKTNLNDIDSKTMKAFLMYLYTGIIEPNQNLTSKLLYAAEKFEVNSLKTFCISCLSENINEQNVLETLVLADHYNDRILEENCLGFIKMKFNQLKDSEDWNKLSMRHALKIMNSLEKSPININIRSSM